MTIEIILFISVFEDKKSEQDTEVHMQAILLWLDSLAKGSLSRKEKGER